MKPCAPRRAVLAALCLSSAAQLAAGEFPTANQVRAAFSAIDANRNGILFQAEWDRASFALFRAADRNKDDFIDREELAASTVAPDTFRRADLNSDNRLSITEFAQQRRAIFEICDIDRTDDLSFVEFELLVVMERAGWVDANQNGRIEISELSASLIRAFGALDLDRDGVLTSAEADYMRPEAFKRFDTNRDGKLSREEYVEGYRVEMIGG